jgi:type IV pilus assembly protein PilB
VQPHGMILSCGPTGSGKTTTQYSVLNKIATPDKNVITIEDPVEYQLKGINQVAVARKAGLTFANAMRAFVRQDPDIIMVGEIRDLETAETAVQAALTGHLVLSTLHTNDAPSAVTRLVDMGVEPFLISASVIGCMAQRLARKICTNCKESYKPPVEALQRVGIRVDGDVTLYRGRGCDVCRHTGYKGRIGLYELMIMNEEIQDLVVKRAPLSEVRNAALANGMKTLRMDGFEKIVEGITTIEEISRVVFTAGESQSWSGSEN